MAVDKEKFIEDIEDAEYNTGLEPSLEDTHTWELTEEQLYFLEDWQEKYLVTTASVYRLNYDRLRKYLTDEAEELTDISLQRNTYAASDYCYTIEYFVNINNPLSDYNRSYCIGRLTVHDLVPLIVCWNKPEKQKGPVWEQAYSKLQSFDKLEEMLGLGAYTKPTIEHIIKKYQENYPEEVNEDITDADTKVEFELESEEEQEAFNIAEFSCDAKDYSNIKDIIIEISSLNVWAVEDGGLTTLYWMLQNKDVLEKIYLERITEYRLNAEKQERHLNRIRYFISGQLNDGTHSKYARACLLKVGIPEVSDLILDFMQKMEGKQYRFPSEVEAMINFEKYLGLPNWTQEQVARIEEAVKSNYKLKEDINAEETSFEEDDLLSALVSDYDYIGRHSWGVARENEFNYTKDYILQNADKEWTVWIGGQLIYQGDLFEMCKQFKNCVTGNPDDDVELCVETSEEYFTIVLSNTEKYFTEDIEEEPLDDKFPSLISLQLLCDWAAENCDGGGWIWNDWCIVMVDNPMGGPYVAGIFKATNDPDRIIRYDFEDVPEEILSNDELSYMNPEETDIDEYVPNLGYAMETGDKEPINNILSKIEANARKELVTLRAAMFTIYDYEGEDDWVEDWIKRHQEFLLDRPEWINIREKLNLNEDIEETDFDIVNLLNTTSDNSSEETVWQLDADALIPLADWQNEYTYNVRNCDGVAYELLANSNEFRNFELKRIVDNTKAFIRYYFSYTYQGYTDSKVIISVQNSDLIATVINSIINKDNNIEVSDELAIRMRRVEALEKLEEILKLDNFTKNKIMKMTAELEKNMADSAARKLKWETRHNKKKTNEDIEETSYEVSEDIKLLSSKGFDDGRRWIWEMPFDVLDDIVTKYTGSPIANQWGLSTIESDKLDPEVSWRIRRTVEDAGTWYGAHDQTYSTIEVYYQWYGYDTYDHECMGNGRLYLSPYVRVWTGRDLDNIKADIDKIRELDNLLGIPDKLKIDNLITQVNENSIDLNEDISVDEPEDTSNNICDVVKLTGSNGKYRLIYYDINLNNTELVNDLLSVYEQYHLEYEDDPERIKNDIDLIKNREKECILYIQYTPKYNEYYLAIFNPNTRGTLAGVIIENDFAEKIIGDKLVTDNLDIREDIEEEPITREEVPSYSSKYLNWDAGTAQREKSIELINEHWNEKIWYLGINNRYWGRINNMPEGYEDYNGLMTFEEAYMKLLYYPFDLSADITHSENIQVLIDGYGIDAEYDNCILYRHYDEGEYEPDLRVVEPSDKLEEDIEADNGEEEKFPTYCSKYLNFSKDQPSGRAYVTNFISEHWADPIWYLVINGYYNGYYNDGDNPKIPAPYAQYNGLKTFEEAYKLFEEYDYGLTGGGERDILLCAGDKEEVDGWLEDNGIFWRARSYSYRRWNDDEDNDFSHDYNVYTLEEDIEADTTNTDLIPTYDSRFLNWDTPGTDGRKASLDFINQHWQDRVWYLVINGDYSGLREDIPEPYESYNGLKTFQEAYEALEVYDFDIPIEHWGFRSRNIMICAKGFLVNDLPEEDGIFYRTADEELKLHDFDVNMTSADELDEDIEANIDPEIDDYVINTKSEPQIAILNSGILSRSWLPKKEISNILTKIEIPHRINGTIISGVARFDSLENLETVVLPNSVIFISSSAFYNCPKLKNINFPPNLSDIYSYAFAYCGLTDIVFPANIEYLGFDSFAYCDELETVTFTDCNLSDSKAVFENCPKLKKFTFKKDFWFKSGLGYCSYDDVEKFFSGLNHNIDIIFEEHLSHKRMISILKKFAQNNPNFHISGPDFDNALEEDIEADTIEGEKIPTYCSKYLNYDKDHSERKEVVKFINEHWAEPIWYLIVNNSYNGNTDTEYENIPAPYENYNGLKTFEEAYKLFEGYDFGISEGDMTDIALCADGFGDENDFYGSAIFWRAKKYYSRERAAETDFSHDYNVTTLEEDIEAEEEPFKDSPNPLTNEDIYDIFDNYINYKNEPLGIRIKNLVINHKDEKRWYVTFAKTLWSLEEVIESGLTFDEAYNVFINYPMEDMSSDEDVFMLLRIDTTPDEMINELAYGGHSPKIAPLYRTRDRDKKFTQYLETHQV